MKEVTKRKNLLKDERGMATIESIPLVLLFVFLLAYSLGAFGIIHTGIMNSISARAYAFETFRNRTNLVYFRDTPGPASHTRQFRSVGNRTHGIMAEDRREGDNQYRATERPIRLGIRMPNVLGRNEVNVHNEKVHSQDLVGTGKRNTQVEVHPAWIMVQYGICINANCGD
jgi:hypothetical protein